MKTNPDDTFRRALRGWQQEPSVANLTLLYHQILRRNLPPMIEGWEPGELFRAAIEKEMLLIPRPFALAWSFALSTQSWDPYTGFWEPRILVNITEAGGTAVGATILELVLYIRKREFDILHYDSFFNPVSDEIREIFADQFRNILDSAGWLEGES